MPKGIDPMARVVVVRVADKPRAIAMQVVRDKKQLDFAGATLRWQPGQASALDSSQIASGRDVGTITAQRKDSAGAMVDIPYDVTFAFVFHAFNPETKIVTQ